MSSTLDPNWKSSFSPSALERGAAYARAGKVALMEEVKRGWEATVRGRTPYRVFVPTQETGSVNRLATCTCPWFAQGNLCKHIAAACFALDSDEPNEARPAPKERIPEETPLSQLVTQADEKVVREFLLDTLAADELLAARFRVACNPADVDLARQTLKRELSAIVRGHSYRGFIDYHAAMPFARDYHDMIDRIIGPFAAQGNGETVFDLVDVVITSLRSIRIDDSDGFFGDTLMICRDYWDKAFAGFDEKETALHARRLVKRADAISRAKRPSDIDWFLVEEMEGYVVDRFGDSAALAPLMIELADKNIERAKANLEKRRKDLKARRIWIGGVPGASDHTSEPIDYETPRWTVVRMHAMRSLGASVDELLEYAHPQATSQEVLLELADLLVGDGRESDAVSLLAAAADDERVSSVTAYAAQLRLREIFRSSGDTARLRRTLIWLLAEASGTQRSPSPVTILHELRELTQPDEWPRLRGIIFDQMRDVYALCACLADEEMADELISVLESRGTYVSLANYESLLVHKRPEWLVERYRERAEQDAELAHDRRGYRSCAGLLAHLAELPGGGPIAQELAAAWRTRWPRRTSLAEELTRAGF